VTLFAIPGLVPERYAAHALHSGPRAFPESNCYVDLWIELLSALGLEPHALLSHTLTVAFEGDQWTFFKPSTEDLRLLYGLEVVELQIWDRFALHVIEQLRRGRLVLAEADAFFLPDTAGTSYHAAHVKTTIGIERADAAERRLGYFHNGGYHTLEGADFDGVLTPRSELPPYVELVKVDRLERLGSDEVKRRSKALLRRDVERRSPRNPVIEYAERFGEHAERLDGGDLDRFHAYAFATLRQCGAAFELAARYLRWLLPEERRAQAAAEAFDDLALGSKAALFKLARAVQRKQPKDLGPLVVVADRWQHAFVELVSLTGEPS